MVRYKRCGASIVDQYIEPSKLFDRLTDHATTVFFLTHVALQRYPLDPFMNNMINNGLCTGL